MNLNFLHRLFKIKKYEIINYQIGFTALIATGITTAINMTPTIIPIIILQQQHFFLHCYFFFA
jgi:hypothetical protein